MPVLGALRRAVGVLPLPALHRGAAPTPSARFSGLQCPSRGLCTATPAKRVKGPRHKGPKHVVRKPQLGVAEAQMPPLATVSRSVMPGYVVLEDVRSARNTGHIIRTACVSAMAGVCFTGITSGVSRKVMRASLGAEQCIGLHHGSTVADIVSQLRHDHPDPIVVCVETTPVSVDSRVFFERHAHNIASRGVVLVMGQETTGIPEDTLASIPHHIHLPLRGFKSSLNVSDCAAVIMSQLHVAMLTHAPQAFKQETFADVSLPALREYPPELSSRPINEHSDAFTVWANKRLGQTGHPVPYG